MAALSLIFVLHSMAAATIDRPPTELCGLSASRFWRSTKKREDGAHVNAIPAPIRCL
jgi:hypothetical protein